MISIVYNGRKIKIERGECIEGPPHFKLYKGLTLDETVQPPEITFISKLKPLVSQGSLSNSDNIKKVDNVIEYIKNYKTSGLPSVGICILTKDHLGLIKDCCESILDKVHYPNVKLYIFDTGSTDKTVWDYYETLKNRRIPMKIIPMNYFHFSRNYNEGISGIDTDVVLILNNDTVAINDYVSKLMKIAIVNKVGTCGPRMLYKDGKIQHDGQIIFNDNGTFAHPGHVNLGALASNTPGGRHLVNGITGAGLFIRTDLYRKMGGFEESFKDIYQDVHFNIHMKALGYSAVCDRDAVILHYDNTSRQELWNDKNEAGKMAQDSKHLYSDILVKDKFLANAGIPHHIEFSIITLVNNKEQYLNFLNDIKNQTFKGTYEIIALPNFNNEYSSCAEALNIGKDIAAGKFCIYCHQDLRVPGYWLEHIHSHTKELDFSKTGFIGMSGASKPDDGPNSNGVGASYLTNPLGNDTHANMFRKMLGKRCEVQTLDELCIIGKRDNRLRFDEITFNHYHWYGADICLQSLNSGLKNYAIDAECFHISDGLNNFAKEDHQKMFIEGAKKLFGKWKAKTPYFRTTTTGFSVPRNEIQILFASALTSKYGIAFPSVINP